MIYIYIYIKTLPHFHCQCARVGSPELIAGDYFALFRHFAWISEFGVTEHSRQFQLRMGRFVLDNQLCTGEGLLALGRNFMINCLKLVFGVKGRCRYVRNIYFDFCCSRRRHLNKASSIYCNPAQHFLDAIWLNLVFSPPDNPYASCDWWPINPITLEITVVHAGPTCSMHSDRVIWGCP